MATTDPSPLGDTTEHAGTQSTEGHTVDDPERDASAPTDGASGEGDEQGRREKDERVPSPESERIANRPV